MTRQEWKDSSMALRRLLRDIPKRIVITTNLQNKYEYKFGSVYLTEKQHWLIYNYVTDNVIAVIAYSPTNRFNVRYRPNSKYAGIIKNRDWGVYEESFVGAVRLIPSNNLRRYSGVARIHLREMTRRAMEAFLGLRLSNTEAGIEAAEDSIGRQPPQAVRARQRGLSMNPLPTGSGMSTPMESATSSSVTLTEADIRAYEFGVISSNPSFDSYAEYDRFRQEAQAQQEQIWAAEAREALRHPLDRVEGQALEDYLARTRRINGLD